MLIYIDNTIGEYLKKKELNDEQTMLFNDIAQSNRRGLCIACGDIKSIDALLSKKDISSIIKSLRENTTDLISLAELVEHIFVITCRETIAAQKLPRYINEKARFLPIEDADRWTLQVACSLVSENSKDCTFYEQVGKYFCYSNRLKGLSIKFEPVNGAGDYTGKELINCVENQNHFALCIVDRDCRYAPIVGVESAVCGETYSAAQKAVKYLQDNGYENAFCFFPLDIHEIENLIPICVLEKLSDPCCAKDGLALIKNLKSKCDGVPILYYDFKKGLKHEGDEAYLKYWESILQKLSLGTQSWENTFRPLGRKVLDGANAFMKETSVDQLVLDDYLFEIWQELGKRLFTWGCTKLPTNS